MCPGRVAAEDEDPIPPGHHFSMHIVDGKRHYQDLGPRQTPEQKRQAEQLKEACIRAVMQPQATPNL